MRASASGDGAESAAPHDHEYPAADDHEYPTADDHESTDHQPADDLVRSTRCDEWKSTQFAVLIPLNPRVAANYGLEYHVEFDHQRDQQLEQCRESWNSYDLVRASDR
ncbi:MAG: hypothetical protein NVSMB2_07480 [Chloroflexota bacterium]